MVGIFSMWKRVERLQHRVSELEKSNSSLNWIEKALKKAGEPTSSVIQYARIGKRLAEDDRFLDYETHPLMRVISMTTRSWCDRQLMNDDRLAPSELECNSERFWYEELKTNADSWNSSEAFSRFYGGCHEPLLPPRQSEAFDKKLFHEFSRKEYDRLLVPSDLSPSRLTDDTVELGVDAINCAPWNYDRFFDSMERNDPSQKGEEWDRCPASSYVMTLPFCMTAVHSTGNHATVSGILLHTGRPKLNRIDNYTMSPMFDRVSTDGGTWQIDGKPYCYVSDPLAAKIWELCRAVHQSPYPIRYRGVVVNPNPSDNNMGKA